MLSSSNGEITITNNVLGPNVPTIKDLKDDLYCYISDVSKDVQGFRTRLNPNNYTIEQLMEMADMWEREVIRSIEEDKIREAADIAEFEKLVDETIALGAGNRDTAIRWLRSADEWYMDDIEYFCFSYGLPYHYLGGVAYKG